MSLPSSGPFAPSPALPPLTGLRGLAALWVVALHLWPCAVGAFGFSRQPSPIREGYLGVDLFFILSGFILCHVYYAAFPQYTIREHRHFLLIRLARIYPLHGFALLLLGIVALTVQGFVQRYPPAMFSGQTFVASALLLQNWIRNPIVWNVPAWSLSAEWAAYLAFPLTLALTRRANSAGRAVFAAAVLLVFLASVFWWFGGGLNYPGMKGGLLRLTCEFVAGGLLCRAYRLGLPAGGFWPQGNVIALVWFALAISSPRIASLAVVPFGYIVLSLAQYRGWLNNMLSSKAARFGGEISYSLYMMHYILIELAEWYMDRAGMPPASAPRKTVVLLLVPAILLVSTATWRFIERPARSAGRRLADRLAPTA